MSRRQRALDAAERGVRGAWRRFKAWAWDWLSARSWKGVAIAIAITIAVGTLGFMVFGGLGPVDALYMSVITVSTVGFGDDVPRDSVPGRLFVTVFVLVGVGIVSLSISRIAAAMVEGRIRQVLGRRRMELRIEQLKDHIILCGFGRFGQLTAAEITRAGLQVVALDVSEEVVSDAEEHGILALQADATEEESLEKAGIARARSLLCALPSDADNVYTILTARDIRPDIPVVALARDRNAERKLRVAGADQVISPYAIGAQHMARQIVSPHVAQVVGLATAGAAGSQTGGVLMEELPVREGSLLVGMTLRNSPLRDEYDVMVVARVSNGGKLREFNPGPDTVFSVGDVLVCVGEARKLVKLQSDMMPAPAADGGA